MDRTRATATLRALIENASLNVGAEFDRRGCTYATWRAIRRDGSDLLLRPPPNMDKDDVAGIIRAVFAEEDVLRYVFFDEAWTAICATEEEAEQTAASGGAASHPNRCEVVMFSGEDADTGMFLAAHREIMRPPVGKPFLGPLTWIDDSFSGTGGRLVGMLPRRGRLQ
jgi:hypothetical protein